MKIINYITYDSWWDTDKTIIPQLIPDFFLNTYILSPKEGKKYEKKEKFGDGEHCEEIQKYRDRDVRSLFVALRLFHRIRKHLNKDEWFWYIMGGNIFFMLLLLFFLPKNRTIISFHNYIPHSKSTKTISTKVIERMFETIKNFLCRKYIYFFFYSKQQQESFTKDYPKKKSTYCNMPLKDIGTVIPKEHIGRTFLFFGAIQEYKRLDLFIKAANKVKNENAKFIIAGQPIVDWKQYESLITNPEKFICDIRFIGEEDVPLFFEIADFLVLPYSDSTQSGPSLIAINYGIPIIASNIPTFKSMIRDGENGFLFENGNERQLTLCFEKAINLSQSEYKFLKATQIQFKNIYSETADVKVILENLLHL